tara:strand:- start:1422 stop:2723 length:1302 start_codon:yes stop_codon:yes gene_type:complete
MKNNQIISYQKKCKICGNKNLKKVVNIEEQYLSATFVKTNHNNPLKKIKTPLTLILCSSDKKNKGCGLLQLYEVVKPDLLYRKYFYRSSTNDTMRKDLKDVTDRLSKIVKPKKNDLIVDIGSNDNTLLNFYDKKFEFIGFEPAQNILKIKSENKINVVKNYFNFKEFNKISNKKAKIISSCAMFYDLKNPKLFVKDIGKIINDDGVWCVQISYLLNMITNMNFYDICHEHLSYYSIDSFERLIKPFGLKIFLAETNAVNGGSIRFYVCKKECKKYDKNIYFEKFKRLKEIEKKYKLKSKETYFVFEKQINNLKNITKKYIDKNIENNKKIVGLGASTKGNILLQHFGLNKKYIPYISEINKFKIGLRCIGTDIKLISEKEMNFYKPDIKLVLPWYFKNEIIKREKQFLNRGGTLYFPMPYPHIVTLKKEKKIF